MSVNKVILIGNVGQDPRVKYFDTGSAVATFPLATTDRGYTLANGTQIPEERNGIILLHPTVWLRLWTNMCTKVTNCIWRGK